jgi:multiple sugar transport system permease protein
VAGKLRLKWQVHLKEKYGSIDKLNATYLEINPAFEMLEPPSEKLDHQKWKPREGQKWEDWIEFKNTLPPNFRIPIRGEWMQQQYLRSQYINQIDSVPAEIRRGAADFSDIRLVSEGPFYEEFMEAAVPPVFGGVLIEETWAERSDAPMPILSEEADFVVSNSKEIKGEFIARSYKWVIGYILINGRSLTNTLIFCALAIGLQLIINPLAAYALSRFPIKLTAQILIFLLATMAFPAEVAMIPSFLLLKNLGLLNTFAALVLPTAANGFMIFLLKGFFDSLPREIFESGQIDGAKEHTMMVKLALPLSKPVLGYMALLAFMGAYGSFMYAFLVAQDRDMWTLMVFIYQLQGFAPKHTIMAAVTLAAIPTLLVFLAAQRVIMRGIVLPSER